MVKFASTAEAEGHIDQIDRLLRDPRLAQYLAATDRNYETTTLGRLQTMRALLDQIEDALNHCN